jgi:hypothetical protein
VSFALPAEYAPLFEAGSQSEVMKLSGYVVDLEKQR